MANLTSILPKKIFSVLAYRNALLKLLPKGPIWNNLSVTTKLFFEAIAVEFDRVDTRFVDLQREATPGLSTSAELLSDWENEAGVVPLPGDSDTVRQNRVHTKLRTNYGNPTDQFFIDYALSAYGITITMNHTTAPALCGIALCGDTLNASNGNYVYTIVVVSDPNSKLAEFKAWVEFIKPAHTLALYA